RKMTPNRQKYCLVVIRQLKKNKDAGPFNGPVDPVKLKIPDYPNIIKNPQDLGTIEKRLQKNEYETIDAFMEAVFLVFSNCERYNGLESPINKMALRVKEQFERQIRSMPPPDFSAPANNKKSKKATPHVATNDGRPKREIHAPPPKSLPYQNVPVRRGKHAQQLKFCGQVLRELQRKQHEPYAFPFYVPVDPVALNIPEYTKVIKHPMDLGTIDSKLKQGEYESAEDFEFDVRLIFRNCYKFNPPGTPVQAMGKKLEAVFNQKWAEKPVPRAQQGESDSDDSDDGKMQTVQMLTKQLEAMKNQIAGLKQGKTKKKERSQPIRKSYAAQQASKKRGRQSAYDDVDESPMIPTFEQKTALSTKMGYMTEHQMPVVIQILKRTESNFDPEDEEVELDVDKVHPQTIRLLWNWI
ncbi:Bromodomain-containing protein, partial [Protomyces lactucae-debilis]